MATVLRLLALCASLLLFATPTYAQPPPDADADADSDSEVESPAIPTPPTSGYATPAGYTPTAPARPSSEWHGQPSGQWQPQPANEPRLRAHRIRYREGMIVPPGGSLVRRYSKGLLFPGLIGFLVTYSMNLVSSTFGGDNAIMAIPVVGLPIWQARYGRSDDRPLVAVHTAIQLASLVLLAVGLIPRRYVEYFTLQPRSKAARGARWALAPRVDRHGGSLTLTLF